jgi:hypothetical protein
MSEIICKEKCDNKVILRDPKSKCNVSVCYDGQIKSSIVINKGENHTNQYAHGGKAYQKLSCKAESKNKYNTLIFSNNRKCCSVKPIYKTPNKPFRMTGAERSGTKIAQSKYNAKTRGRVSEPYYNFF